MGRVRKRILAAVLAACLAVMPAATVSAVEGVADVDPAVQRGNREADGICDRA